MDAVTAPPRTLLSLEKFRQLLGFNPAFFWGAAGATVFPQINQCDDIFYQFYWQKETQVSREEIANAIKEAEEDIARIMGFYPAPVWIEDVYNYPRNFRRDVIEWGMSDSRGYDKQVQLNHGKFIQGGQRAVTLIDDAVTVVYTDTDGDGYDETATVTAATSLTDACEIHCYFAGESGNPDWEVRSPRSVTISGGNVVFKFWAWQLLDPELQQRLTVSTQTTPIDVEAAASYVATVDVYREYNDFTEASAQFFWNRERLLNTAFWPVGWCCSSCGGIGCEACTFITQDGCVHVTNAAGSFASAFPADYDSDNAQWNRVAPTVCRDPDMVKLWYLAGDQSQEYKAGRTCEPLSQFWAQNIAWLATARTNRPFCACNNSQAFPDSPTNLQRDLAFTGSRQLGSFRVSEADLNNPLGTRAGEVRVWKRINNIIGVEMMGVAI